MIWRRLLLISLFVAIACFKTERAQGADGPEHREWETSGFAGGSFMQSIQRTTRVLGSDKETSRTVGLNYATSYQIGIRVSENLGNYWAANLEYSFANQPLTFTNLSPDIQRLSLSHSVHHFSYNALFLPTTPEHRFRPYATAGAGAALFYITPHSKSDALLQGLDLRDSWKITFNWGGGLKYLVRDKFALVFDAKDQISGVPSYGLPSSTRVINGLFRPGFNNDGLLHNWQINFGLGYQWDD